jgi:hypothetical protein
MFYDYKDQSVNVVYGHNRCLFREQYGTYKELLCTKCIVRFKIESGSTRSNNYAVNG